MSPSNSTLDTQLVPSHSAVHGSRDLEALNFLASRSVFVSARKFRSTRPNSHSPVRIRRSMCSYAPALVLSVLVKLVLIQLTVDLCSKHVQLHHGANAFLRGPARFVGPAAYYFQLPPERRKSADREPKPSTMSLERLDWLRQMEEEAPLVEEPEPDRDRLLSSASTSRTRTSAATTTTRCDSSITSNDCQKSGENAAAANKREMTETTKQQIIERYKSLILHQMNMDHIPDHPPITENATSWKALPAILRDKLKAEVDSSNQLMDVPVVEDEEKESFIMLKEYPFVLDSIPSMAFVLKIADDIDPNHVKDVWIHVEHTDDVPTGTEMTIWEIVPSLTLFDPTTAGELYQTSDPLFDSNTPDQYTDTMIYPSTANEDELADATDIPSVTRSSSSSSPSRTFKLIRPRIASARVRNTMRGNSTRFDVTGKLISWLKHRKRTRRTGPIIRYLLLVCPRCEQFQPVDPKKVVMEITYRQALRRRRRSLNGTDDGLTNSCQEDGQQFTCCTQPLKIQFSEIGWDRWIIHPKKFEPNFCRGSCQVNGFQSTHYEVLNVLSHKNVSQLKDVPRGSIQSCCYPTRRTTFTLLYLDRNKDVRMHTLHNLIVLGCGCS